MVVTPYGGTFTSLSENGWTLGDGFCFRTVDAEAEGGYAYSSTFIAGATVV